MSTIAWTVICDNDRDGRIIFSNTLNKSIKTSVSPISFDYNWNFFIHVPFCQGCVTGLNDKMIEKLVKLILTCKRSSCSRFIWISKWSFGNPLIQRVTRSLYALVSNMRFLYKRLANFSLSSWVLPCKVKIRWYSESSSPKLPNFDIIRTSSSGKYWEF